MRTKALLVAGRLARMQGDYERVGALAGEAVALARAESDTASLADALQLLALVAAQSDRQQAQTRFNEALGLLRTVGHRAKLGWALCQMGSYANHGSAADRERAIGLLEEALALFRSVGHTPGTATALGDLSHASFVRGDLRQALALGGESVALRWELQDRWGLTGGLGGMAEHARLGGHPQRAARLMGASDALREAVGVPVDELRRPMYERAVAELRAALTADGFAAEWAAGRAMPLEQAVAEALATAAVSVVADMATAPSAPHPPTDAAAAASARPVAAVSADRFALSKREREVLALLVNRYTDPEIAAALFLSVRTVENHVAHIFNKLGVAHRREAAALAARHGLA